MSARRWPPRMAMTVNVVPALDFYLLRRGYLVPDRMLWSRLARMCVATAAMAGALWARARRCWCRIPARMSGSSHSACWWRAGWASTPRSARHSGCIVSRGGRQRGRRQAHEEESSLFSRKRTKKLSLRRLPQGLRSACRRIRLPRQCCCRRTRRSKGFLVLFLEKGRLSSFLPPMTDIAAHAGLRCRPAHVTFTELAPALPKRAPPPRSAYSAPAAPPSSQELFGQTHRRRRRLLHPRPTPSLAPTGIAIKDGRGLQLAPPSSTRPYHVATVARRVLNGRTFPVRHVRGPLAVIYGPGHETYGHWLVDFLPRLWVLAQAGHDILTLRYAMPPGFANPSPPGCWRAPACAKASSSRTATGARPCIPTCS